MSSTCSYRFIVLKSGVAAILKSDFSLCNMYIGPWQEYALSRVKDPRRVADGPSGFQIPQHQQEGVGAIRDLESIRQALQAALPPEEAQRALQSLQPLLGKQGGHSNIPTDGSRKSLPQLRIPVSSNQGRNYANSFGSKSNGVGSNFDRENIDIYKQYSDRRGFVPAPSQPSNPTQRQGRHLRKIHQSLLNPGIYKLSHDSDSFKYESFGESSTPMSVRSTMSEPIQSVGFSGSNKFVSTSPHVQQQRLIQQTLPSLNGKLDSLMTSQHNPSKSRHQRILDEESLQLQLRQSNQNMDSSRIDSEFQQSQQNDTKQPPYNSAAMISLLKLERATRPPKPDLGKFWSWKGNDESSLNSRGDSNNLNDVGDSKGKKEKELTEKLSRVKKMQELYSTQAKSENHQSEESEETSPSCINLKSPIRVSSTKITSRRILSPPNLAGPRIHDMDITDSELMLVSKYFNNETGYMPSNDSPTTPHSTELQLSPQMNGNSYDSGDFHPSPNRRNVGTAGSEELYSAGLDGLLKWSSMLSDE